MNDLNLDDMPMSTESSVEFLAAAIKEIKNRLALGDVESSISICNACEVAIQSGYKSSAFKAFITIERARLA